MAVLSHSEKQKLYSSTMFGALILASVVFAALLLAQAGRLSDSTGTVVGSFGPLQLFEITKNAMSGGGYSGGIRLLYGGVMAYFALWLLVGFIASLLRARSQNR